MELVIFSYLLKQVGAETEEDVLKWSVMYGWGLVAASLLSFVILGVFLSLPENIQPILLMKCISFIWLAAFILFIFRYTSVKPMLGAAAAGITTITIASVFDSWSDRRDSSLTMGAFLGVVLVLSVLLTKNIIVSWYYLISETVRYMKYHRKQITLETTVLK